MCGMRWQLLVHSYLHATLEVSCYHTTNVKENLKSLVVYSVWRIRSWVWSHWIFLLIAINLILNSISLVLQSSTKTSKNEH
jgi:hypothetical protein